MEIQHGKIGAFRSTSPDEASVNCGSLFYPHTTKKIGPGPDFVAVQQYLQLGPLTVSDTTFSTDVKINFEGDSGGYMVCIPTHGSMSVVHRNESLIVSPATAAITLPEGEITAPHWRANARALTVHIDRHVIERGILQSTSMQQYVPFKMSMDISRGRGQKWLKFLMGLHRQLLQEPSYLDEPSIVAPLADSLVNALLLAAEHPYHSILNKADRPGRSKIVKTAIEAIENSPQTPWTVSSIAAECFVSVRTLQEAFRKQAGTTPMEYVRSTRLRRAYQELYAYTPSDTTVTSVAKRWGFHHMSYFSSTYADMFHEYPSETLRRACKSLQSRLGGDALAELLAEPDPCPAR